MATTTLEMTNWFHKPGARTIRLATMPAQLSDSQQRRLRCSSPCECGGWVTPPAGYKAAYPWRLRSEYLSAHGFGAENLVIYPASDAQEAEE